MIVSVLRWDVQRVYRDSGGFLSGYLLYGTRCGRSRVAVVKLCHCTIALCSVLGSWYLIPPERHPFHPRIA